MGNFGEELWIIQLSSKILYLFQREIKYCHPEPEEIIVQKAKKCISSELKQQITTNVTDLLHHAAVNPREILAFTVVFWFLKEVVDVYRLTDVNIWKKKFFLKIL